MGAIDGQRVVGFAALGPAALASMLLVDMGVEVIRVERPELICSVGSPPANGPTREGATGSMAARPSTAPARSGRVRDRDGMHVPAPAPPVRAVGVRARLGPGAARRRRSHDPGGARAAAGRDRAASRPMEPSSSPPAHAGLAAARRSRIATDADRRRQKKRQASHNPVAFPHSGAICGLHLGGGNSR